MRDWRLPYRVCENCFVEFETHHPAQRWCGSECRDEYRRDELRAARKLWVREGKPQEVLEQCRERRD